MANFNKVVPSERVKAALERICLERCPFATKQKHPRRPSKVAQAGEDKEEDRKDDRKREERHDSVSPTSATLLLAAAEAPPSGQESNV
jgi:hypothetical protein